MPDYLTNLLQRPPVGWWDLLDILYFGTYAIWTYISTPFVFLREGYELSELELWEERGERWRRLAVRFPDGLQTHSREQVCMTRHRPTSGLNI